jgi:hypothetical protein
MPPLRIDLVNSPYLGIWIRPRKTIRSIIQRDPRNSVIALVVVAALLGAIGAQFNPNLAQDHMTLVIGAGDLVRPRFPRFLWLLVWPVAAVAFLYVEGALVRWGGGLLGGSANAVEVRAALAWPEVITIVTTLGFILIGIVSPSELLMAAAGVRPLLPNGVWFLSLTVGIPLFIWRFVVLISCIGEVHRFSFWRGLGAWAIAMCLIVLALCFANAIAALAVRL